MTMANRISRLPHTLNGRDDGFCDVTGKGVWYWLNPRKSFPVPDDEQDAFHPTKTWAFRNVRVPVPANENHYLRPPLLNKENDRGRL